MESCRQFHQRRFGSFFYKQVTRKKAAETTFVQKICTYNVDEIDTLAIFTIVWKIWSLINFFPGIVNQSLLR